MSFAGAHAARVPACLSAPRRSRRAPACGAVRVAPRMAAAAPAGSINFVKYQARLRTCCARQLGPSGAAG
jgi:hypothetical protein